LVPESWRSDEEVEKPSVQLRLIDSEKKVVAADNRALQPLGHDPETAHLGVDLGDQKLSSLTNLLLLGLDFSAGNRIAQNDALCMELHSTSFVCRQVVDLDKFLAMAQHLPQRHQRPRLTHLVSPVCGVFPASVGSAPTP
jgi:hypothetical protein